MTCSEKQASMFKAFDDHTYSAGIGLGYQHAFFSRLRVDGGIRFMYIIETEHESYRSDGTVQYYYRMGGHGIGGGLYLKVGYAF